MNSIRRKYAHYWECQNRSCYSSVTQTFQGRKIHEYVHDLYDYNRDGLEGEGLDELLENDGSDFPLDDDPRPEQRFPGQDGYYQSVTVVSVGENHSVGVGVGGAANADCGRELVLQKEEERHYLPLSSLRCHKYAFSLRLFRALPRIHPIPYGGEGTSVWIYWESDAHDEYRHGDQRKVLRNVHEYDVREHEDLELLARVHLICECILSPKIVYVDGLNPSHQSTVHDEQKNPKDLKAIALCGVMGLDCFGGGYDEARGGVDRERNQFAQGGIVEYGESLAH